LKPVSLLEAQKNLLISQEVFLVACAEKISNPITESLAQFSKLIDS